MENKKLHMLIQQLAEREKFADWQIIPLSYCSPAITAMPCRKEISPK